LFDSACQWLNILGTVEGSVKNEFYVKEVAVGGIMVLGCHITA
jgi:hypothetical protein